MSKIWGGITVWIVLSLSCSEDFSIKRVVREQTEEQVLINLYSEKIIDEDAAVLLNGSLRPEVPVFRSRKQLALSFHRFMDFGFLQLRVGSRYSPLIPILDESNLPRRLPSSVLEVPVIENLWVENENSLPTVVLEGYNLGNYRGAQQLIFSRSDEVDLYAYHEKDFPKYRRAERFLSWGPNRIRAVLPQDVRPGPVFLQSQEERFSNGFYLNWPLRDSGASVSARTEPLRLELVFPEGFELNPESRVPTISPFGLLTVKLPKNGLHQVWKGKAPPGEQLVLEVRELDLFKGKVWSLFSESPFSAADGRVFLRYELGYEFWTQAPPVSITDIRSIPINFHEGFRREQTALEHLLSRYEVPSSNVLEAAVQRGSSPYYRALSLYRTLVSEFSAAGRLAPDRLWPRREQAILNWRGLSENKLNGPQLLLLGARYLNQLGFPVRIANGALAGPDSRKSGRTQLQRHYWLEIFLPSFGWFRMDPAAEIQVQREVPDGGPLEYWGSLEGAGAQPDSPVPGPKLVFSYLDGTWDSFDSAGGDFAAQSPPLTVDWFALP